MQLNEQSSHSSILTPLPHTNSHTHIYMIWMKMYMYNTQQNERARFAQAIKSRFHPFTLKHFILCLFSTLVDADFVFTVSRKSVQWLFVEWETVWLITTISSVVASYMVYKYMCDVSINKENHYIVSISPQKLHTVNACHLFCTHSDPVMCLRVETQPNAEWFLNF